MTEMVYGTVRAGAGEPILPRWWRTVDKATLAAVATLFAIGLSAGAGFVAATGRKKRSRAFPLRDATSGVRRRGAGRHSVSVDAEPDAGPAPRIASVCLLHLRRSLALPIFGTDFGKGATRWYSLGFASVQPSEFLKPGFVVLSAWLLAAGQEINGPPGKMISLFVTLVIVGFLAVQPDFGQACLIIFGWSVMYFVAGAPMLLVLILAGIVGMGGVLGLQQLRAFRSPYRWLPVNGSRSDHPARLRHQRHPRRRVLRRRCRRRQCEVVAAGCPHRFHHRRGGRGIRCPAGTGDHLSSTRPWFCAACGG